MLQVGTILHGTYKIESYLASGGFGNTYLAKNIEFDETYAIKEFFVKGVCQRDGNSTTISVSNAENTNSFEQQREKFKKEARRLRCLSNPHIVKVYDLFEENGTAYYVMDYVDGENLSARLKRTNAPLAESEVRNYLNQILDGLEAIHNEGMFHLDIKPANIMVDSHDVVKLIDFGASKQQSTVGGATMSTGISYTNGYAPSEQMAQSYDKFGPWTDFYALGATMYKLLTNQDPPSASDLSEDETEDKHLALPMPNVSEEMKKMVVWMMQVNRFKRPQSVGEIRDLISSMGNKTIGDSEVTIELGTNVCSNKEETIYEELQNGHTSLCNSSSLMHVFTRYANVIVASFAIIYILTYSMSKYYHFFLLPDFEQTQTLETKEVWCYLIFSSLNIIENVLELLMLCVFCAKFLNSNKLFVILSTCGILSWILSPCCDIYYDIIYFCNLYAVPNVDAVLGFVQEYAGWLACTLLIMTSLLGVVKAKGNILKSLFLLYAICCGLQIPGIGASDEMVFCSYIIVLALYAIKCWNKTNRIIFFAFALPILLGIFIVYFVYKCNVV